jgi:hypothetical protein
VLSLPGDISSLNPAASMRDLAWGGNKSVQVGGKEKSEKKTHVDSMKTGESSKWFVSWLIHDVVTLDPAKHVHSRDSFEAAGGDGSAASKSRNQR